MSTCRRFLPLVLVSAFVVLSGVAVRGQGLFGGFFEAVGRATGIKPIADLGRNADAEHKRFKENVDIYKRLEEGVSNTVQAPFSLACTSTFDAVIGAVHGACSGFNSQSYAASDRALIQSAVDRLVSAGIVGRELFSGVGIRWCAGSFSGSGITPAADEILLHTNLKASPVDDIASTVAHEMRHVAQYRQLGSGKFKCDYAQQYVACGGCQDDRHPLEREAYQFEAYAVRTLAATAPVPRVAESTFTPRQEALTRTVRSRPFLADNPPPLKTVTPRIENEIVARHARAACTADGTKTRQLRPDAIEHCLDDLDVIYKDVLQEIDDDVRAGRNRLSEPYEISSRRDRMRACSILRGTESDPRMGVVVQETCEIISRRAILNLRAIVSRKYRKSPAH